jgi:hypothetical protein
MDGVRRELYAIIERAPDPADTQALISTVPQVHQPPVPPGISGRSYSVNYRVMPLISTPFDLHALAVLAVRTLLVPLNQGRTLVDTINLLEDLAERLRRQGDAGRSARPSTPAPAQGPSPAGSDLAGRIAKILRDNPNLLDALGPHRLVGTSFGEVSPADAMLVIPPDLWYSTLAMLIRMYPALGPDSTCQDVGTADRAAVHRVFDQALADASDLLVRSRALLVSDQVANREIVDAILVQLRQL